MPKYIYLAFSLFILFTDFLPFHDNIIDFWPMLTALLYLCGLSFLIVFFYDHTNSLRSFFYFCYSFIHQNMLSVLPMLWILTYKNHNPHFNFNITFKCIYGGHPPHYISKLLLSPSFIHFFSSWTSITPRNLITLDHTFTRGFTSIIVFSILICHV
jgi:hypothetical protein